MHDDEMIGRIAGLYRTANLHVPLAQVQRRAHLRRRNLRMATAGVVTLVVLLAGTAVYAVQARSDRTPGPAAALTATCATRYRALAAAYPDRGNVPGTLPQLVISLTDGAAAFRVYAGSGGLGAVFGCGRSRTGKITADLTVATVPGAEYPAIPWGGNAGLGYYHEFLPDGSGVIVGAYFVGTVHRVTVTSPVTGHVLTAVKGRVFVAWSTTDDLSGATIKIDDSAGTVTTRQPTAVSGSYNADDLAEFCGSWLTGSGDPGQDPKRTAFRLTHTLAGARTVVAWLYPYPGGLIGCVLPDDPDDGGPVHLRSGRATPVLRIGSPARPGQPGWVAGTVLPGTRSVDVIEGGETVPAQVNDGYYVAWVPDVFGAMTIVTTTATGVYASVNGVTTKIG